MLFKGFSNCLRVQMYELYLQLLYIFPIVWSKSFTEYLTLILLGATVVERFDLRTNSWQSVTLMNSRRLQFGAAVMDDKILFVGGRDGLKTLNSVESFHPKSKTWTPLAPMGTHRHGLGKKQIGQWNVNSQCANTCSHIKLSICVMGHCTLLA